MTKISININIFLSFLTQLKINHWQTKSYARHKAFEDTYDQFSEHVDDFIECYIGKYGRFKLDEQSNVITLYNISEMDLNSMCVNVRKSLVEISKNLNEEDKDLLTKVDDMIITVNKLKYLLSLK
jgi:DNA-binding ferritin-like protein